MPERNPSIAQLKKGYIFPEIKKRVKAFAADNPDAKLIALGIGNTTEPLAPSICERIAKTSMTLGTQEGYVGYGPSEGYTELRTKIGEVMYGGAIDAEEIFVSDGCKCDIGRLQMLFGPDTTVAIQDPAYPVYVDTSFISGKQGVIFLPCTPENDFFPDLEAARNADVIFLCSPNNPTGAVATREQLESLVNFAKKNQSIIIFDSAYQAFIQDPTLPKSIFEIPGAREVAIEMGSLSKMAGFTGVRLAWTVVPKELKFQDGSSVQDDWKRVIHTFFNGASYLSQMGALAVLDPKGLQEIEGALGIYRQNAQTLIETLKPFFSVYGGQNCPYVWVKFGGRKSWDVFDELLKETHIITTPGVAFGPAGEGFIRFSAFGHAQNIAEAVARLRDYF